jgi:hypothetical protein
MDNVKGEVDDPYAMILDLPNGNKKQIYFENPKVEPNNAILEELKALANAINNNTRPVVTLQAGYDALVVANQIMDKMQTAISLHA